MWFEPVAGVNVTEQLDDAPLGLASVHGLPVKLPVLPLPLRAQLMVPVGALAVPAAVVSVTVAVQVVD